VSYSASINSAGPIFVVVIMAMASSRPVLPMAERALVSVATIGGCRSELGDDGSKRHTLGQAARACLT
jgi:hypothetical protein